jgi:geranylgeranyl pyrophosphate synthase/predicted secreted hydrolase
MTEYPADWPSDGAIDLTVHDLPHDSSTTEWWYFNAHIGLADGRELSMFASFFRIVKARDEQTKRLLHAGSVTWAISDASGRRYLSESRVDKEAAKLGLERLNRGEGTRDQRLRRAMREVLEKGKVPYPDRVFKHDPYVSDRRLEIDYDGISLLRRDDGSYHIKGQGAANRAGFDLVFRPRMAPVRHGDNGVVKGVGGEDMFYYFIPDNEVTGTVTLDGLAQPVKTGRGWYDHEFGGHKREKDANEAGTKRDIAWLWCAVQLDDGRALSAYSMVDLKNDNASVGRRMLLVDPDGRHESLELSFDETSSWRSTRTFNLYPTGFRVASATLGVDLELTGFFEDQEFVTLISKPAFWEGAVNVAGTIGGKPVTGKGYVERSGFVTVETLDDFFGAVGEEVRKSVEALVPNNAAYEPLRDLVASRERDAYMRGIELGQLARTLCEPVRLITDRGGKSWRSYAALACCDVVGGDSRNFVRWLAMPELMHVGSLMVDDVQDKSTVRRGGPTAHMLYGESLAINSGTACYFMGQKLLVGPSLSDREKLAIYDHYFQALRAGHAGQALDIDGVDFMMADVVETGDGGLLEERILAIHRLKTAIPAASLSRMGAVAGGGTEEQIEGLGHFFESVGLAFQIIDDVLNLRGFKGDLKSRGEDIMHGKVTLPVAKAMARLPREERAWLWETIRSKPRDPAVVGAVIEKVESVGGLDACVEQSSTLVEDAWLRLDPLVEDSMPKLMLRAFGWYVLERHY